MAAKNDLEGFIDFEGPAFYRKTHAYMMTIIELSRKYTMEIEHLQKRERTFFNRNSDFSKQLKKANEENLLKVGALVGVIQDSLGIFENFPIRSPDPTRRNESVYSSDESDDLPSDDFA